MKKLKHILFLFLILIISNSCRPTNNNSKTEDLFEPYNNIIDVQFKGWHILKLGELNTDDIKLWKQNRGENMTPGMAKGKYESKEEMVALLIVSEINRQKKVKLILLKNNVADTPIKILREENVFNYPVIYSLPPAKYNDFYDTTKYIDTKNDCIAYEHIEASTIIYYYDKEKYIELVYSD